MYTERKNDDIVMKAVELSNNGHHERAAALFQRAGNQYRPEAEKKTLWDAAKRSRDIARRD